MSVDSRFAAPALASLKDCALDDPRLPTPLFVIDSQKLEKNLRRAQDRAAKLGVAFRPHLKTHKTHSTEACGHNTACGTITLADKSGCLAGSPRFSAGGPAKCILRVSIPVRRCCIQLTRPIVAGLLIFAFI